MGTTSPLGYPFPEPSDTPDVPRDIKALAEAIQADVMGRVFQAGQVSVTISAGSQDAVKPVTFNPSFPGTPIIIVQGSNRGVHSRSTGASRSGFTAAVRLAAGNAGTDLTEYVRWIAVWLGKDNPTHDASNP